MTQTLPRLSPLERVLALFPEARPSTRGYNACCPVHNDKNPSLSIWEDEKGNCGLHCWAGCQRAAICATLGLQESELYPSDGYRPRKRQPARKIDLLDLAVAKNIHPNLLTSYGVTDGHTGIDSKGKKHPNVLRVAYYRPDGTEHTRARIRPNLSAECEWWDKGPGGPIPYGLQKLAEARAAGYCWIVEGESDSWTLWSHNLPALGIPGATNEDVLQSGMLDDIPQIYIIQEPGLAGAAFPPRVVKRLREIGYAGQCFSVSLQTSYDAKDPNELLIKLWRENRMSEFPALIETARESSQLLEEEKSAVDAGLMTATEVRAIIEQATEADALYVLVQSIAPLSKNEQAQIKVSIREKGKNIAGFSLHDFNGLLKDAQSEYARKEAQERVYVSGRPQILLGRQLIEERTDCLDALHKANARKPRIFVRSGKLCRLVQDEQKRTSIEAMGEDSLISHMTEEMDFVSYNEQKETYSSQHPTPRLAKTILASPQHWRFPPLVGLTEIPIMRADGTILDKPGYDEATRLYYHPLEGLIIPPIPVNPIRLAVLRARDFAFSFFEQFSYASQSDRANAYGLLLSLVMMEIARPALAGLLTAATRGEGKGLLTDALSTVASGFPAHTTTLPRDDAELKKELLGRLADGETFISFDNITGTVASRELDSFLTAANWGGRLLGSNTNLAAEKSRVLTLLNGNNVMLGGDLSRRILPIRLASGSSRPWERPVTYRYSPLLEHITRQRGEIIAALLTMVRGWHLAGRPLAQIRDESCFGPWKRTIGGILNFLEIDGFLGNLDALVEDAAQEDTQWLRFLQTWYETIEEPLTIKELFSLLETEEAFRDTLPDKLAEYYSHADSKKQNPRSFGYALAKRKDTPYGAENFKLAKGPRDSHKKLETWHVIASPMPLTPDEKPSQTTCGFDSPKCGFDEEKINQTRNQTRMVEQALEADGNHVAGLSGFDSLILAREKKNILFSDVPENKKENIIFAYKDGEIDKSNPLKPASDTEVAPENASGMRVCLRVSSFSGPSNTQHEESNPQSAMAEQLLAYGLAQDWPRLLLTPCSSIPAGEASWRLYAAKHNEGELAHALHMAESAGKI